MKRVILLRSVPRKKKKLAASLFFSASRLAIVWASADFPKPAGPLSQHISRLLSSSTHFMTFSIIFPRVPWRHAEESLRLVYAALGIGLSFARESESPIVRKVELRSQAIVFRTMIVANAIVIVLITPNIGDIGIPYV